MFLALMISKMCMYLYDLSTDVLIYCYAIDELVNKEAQWAPEQLKAIVHPVNPAYQELNSGGKKTDPSNDGKKKVRIQG